MIIIFEPVEILGKEKTVAEFRRKEPHWYMESSQRMGVAPRDGENIKITFDGFK